MLYRCFFNKFRYEQDSDLWFSLFIRRNLGLQKYVKISLLAFDQSRERLSDTKGVGAR
jgi:hypothetical protein